MPSLILPICCPKWFPWTTPITGSEALIEMRIQLKSEKYYSKDRTPDLKENIIRAKKQMRQRAEEEILRRVDAIRGYLTDPDRKQYISHEQIFKNYITA